MPAHSNIRWSRHASKKVGGLTGLRDEVDVCSFDMFSLLILLHKERSMKAKWPS